MKEDLLTFFMYTLLVILIIIGWRIDHAIRQQNECLCDFDDVIEYEVRK